MNIRNPFADLSIDSEEEVERNIKSIAIPNSVFILNNRLETKRKRKIRPEEKMKIESEKKLKQITKEKLREETKEQSKDEFKEYPKEVSKKIDNNEIYVEKIEFIHRNGIIKLIQKITKLEKNI